MGFNPPYYYDFLWSIPVHLCSFLLFSLCLLSWWFCVFFSSFPLLVWKWRFPLEACNADLEKAQTHEGATGWRGLAQGGARGPPPPPPAGSAALLDSALSSVFEFQVSPYKFVSHKTHLLIFLQNQCSFKFTTYSPVFSSFLDPSLPSGILFLLAEEYFLHFLLVQVCGKKLSILFLWQRFSFSFILVLLLHREL